MKVEFNNKQLQEAIFALQYALDTKNYNSTSVVCLEHVKHELEFALSIQQRKENSHD